MSGLDETIAKFKVDIKEHVLELKANQAWAKLEKIYRALGAIEELEGVPRTSLADLFGFADAGSASSVTVRPGEFIGQGALEAAKLYLRKKKAEAATLDEIIEAITKGGANSVSRNSLRTSLGRSTWDVVKAPDQELYQLVEFSPHVKRGKKKSGQSVQEEETQADPSSEPDQEVTQA